MINFQNRSPFALLVVLAALPSAGAGSLAEEPVPWHVKEAEVRVPLNISLEGAVRQMPPDVYLADLKPREAKDLSFDPKTRQAVRRDVRTAEEKAQVIANIKEQLKKTGQAFNPAFYRPNERVRGSATFNLRPEYKWFSHERAGGREGRGDHVHVFIDGERIGTGNAPLILALPPGSKTLRIETDARALGEAGFVSRNPVAAEATLFLPGRDPTTLIPIVYDLQGRQVGARILWAQPTEPMSIVFDTSSGEERYMVYLVDRAKNPSRLDWTPRAGLILEGRYPDRYDPAVNTVEGFMKLWDESGFVAGKRSEGSIMRQIFPFRPMGPDTPNFRVPGRRIGQGPGEPPLALARYTGFFHVPATQEYEFLFGVRPGGHLLIDDQLVLSFPHDGAVNMGQDDEDEEEQLASELADEETAEPVHDIKGMRPFKLKLDKGLHKIDVLQYGSAARFDARLVWYNPANPKSSVVFGSGYRVWEPLVRASAGTIAHRENKPFASFTWQYRGTWMPRGYPAGDIIRWSFAGTLRPEREDAVFRWRFDDGHTAEGREIKHRFFAPGMRKVELDVLDGPDGKVVARAAGNVHVRASYVGAGYSWKGADDRSLWSVVPRRQEEYASVTPIREVVSLYYWTLQTNWKEQQIAIGDALSGRIDEVIGAYPHPRLLEMARHMAEPTQRHYDAAEKLLEAVMDRVPVGGHSWNSAAVSLADILASVRGEPDKALRLLETAEKAEPAMDMDMDRGWRTAKAKQWYPRTPEGGDLAAATKDLDWSEPSYLSFLTETEGGRGTWIAKDFLIPASRKGKDFEVDLGQVPYNGMIWFNGKLLGARWGVPDGPVVVPPEMQQYDRENRFLALFQPPDHPDLAHGRQSLRGLSAAEEFMRWRGFTLVATDLYTSPSCEEKGVQYTLYEGDWQSYHREHGTFPELDTMKPIKTGTITDLAFEELRVGSLGHHLPRVGTESPVNLSAEGIEPPFVMKLAGYVRVSPGVYRFRPRNRCKVFVDSRPVTMTTGLSRRRHELGAGGAAFLRGGVHFVEMVYFSGSGRGEIGVSLIVPDTYVAQTEVSADRVKADALLMTGEEEKAKEILLALKPDAWPIGEQQEWQLAGELRRVHRWAERSRLDAEHGLSLIDRWQREHPMLRTMPDFMIAKLAAHSGLEDHERVFALSEPALRMRMTGSQRGELMLLLVRSMVKAGKMDAARDLYGRMREEAPYSTPTAEAREAIVKSVTGK